jgi:hypothetical protein
MALGLFDEIIFPIQSNTRAVATLCTAEKQASHEQGCEHRLVSLEHKLGVYRETLR